MEILIRPLQHLHEIRACEALQRQVWAMPDDLEIVPLHMLLAVQRNGGLLLGAFSGDELLGFVFGFPGRTRAGQAQHYSHMMGVAPGHRGQSIGYRLKLAQREYALGQGYELVTWTYDPLEGRNAYLNIRKLGAVSRTYIRDYYGPMGDGLNVGLPSDRLQVDWWIADPGIQTRLGSSPPPPVPDSGLPVNVLERTSDGLLLPGDLVLDASAQVLRVEIPADFQAIRAADPSAALAWRLAMRRVFECYFDRGYALTDFASYQMVGVRRSYYFLSKV